MIQLREKNPLLDHAWGRSRAGDRVWSQICGFAPSTLPSERRFVVLQACIDDSYTTDGVFVLGGYIASAEAWADFSREWEQLLPLTMKNRVSGKHRFKMSEMARRMASVPPFYSLIEHTVLASISCKINAIDLENAKKRIWFESGHVEWTLANNIFVMCLRLLLDMFHYGRLNDEALKSEIPLDRKVDFYFDTHTSKKIVLEGWEQFIKNRPEEIRQIYGHMPRFENDEEFLPLQAADFWAWWVRKGYEDGNLEKYQRGDFGSFKGTEKLFHIDIAFDEDQLVQTLMADARADIDRIGGQNRPLYDAKYYPRESADALPDRSFFARIRDFFRSL